MPVLVDSYKHYKHSLEIGVPQMASFSLATLCYIKYYDHR